MTEPAKAPAKEPAEEPPKTRLKRWGKRLLMGIGLLLLVIGLFVAVVLVDGWEAMGYAPEGARLRRMNASPQRAGEVFENPQPLWNDAWGGFRGARNASAQSSPESEPPYLDVDASIFESPPPSGLRITWLGHSTLLIEIDGHRFLTDPVWGERTSPVNWLGPERWYPPPLPLSELPELDAVILSHDHYDHLDHPTIVALSQRVPRFVVPLGVGAHLAGWGVPEEHITELDWWDRHRFGDLELVMTPARHASGRHLLDQNRTLWAGYALIGATHRAYFSGDTGLFPAMREIGARLGPFDVTMIEVGAYHSAWPDWHLGPEQAIRAHGWVRGQLFVPIHWGLFDLAYHGWTEPIERSVAAARRAEVPLVAPRPGQSFEPTSPPPIERWWPELPWRTGEEDPIRATGFDIDAAQ